MPITVAEVGITGIADFALLAEAEVEVALEETEPLLKYDGTLDDEPADAFNPEIKFSFKGYGDSPAGFAAGVIGSDGGFTHDAITGGVTIVDAWKDSEKDSANNEWEISGTNCPNAEVPA